ncbi:MAG: hypothetical protein U0869_01105 [Chloroflexota bacterium]
MLATDAAGTLLDLRVPLAATDERAATDLTAVVAAVRARAGQEPSLLAWGADLDIDPALTDGGLLRAVEPVRVGSAARRPERGHRGAAGWSGGRLSVLAERAAWRRAAWSGSPSCVPTIAP